MTRALGWLWLILLGFGCGPSEGARGLGHLSAEVRLAPGLAPTAIKTVEIYVLAGHTRNGAAFDCAALAGASPNTRDDLVPRGHLIGPLVDTELPGLPPETSLVVTVDTYPTMDATGPRNGAGCADGIVIKEGETSAVTLSIAPAP